MARTFYQNKTYVFRSSLEVVPDIFSLPRIGAGHDGYVFFFNYMTQAALGLFGSRTSAGGIVGHLGHDKPQHSLKHIADGNDDKSDPDGGEQSAQGESQGGTHAGGGTIDAHGRTHLLPGEPGAQHLALQNLGGQEEGTGQEGDDEQGHEVGGEAAPDLTDSRQRQQHAGQHPHALLVHHAPQPHAEERTGQLAYSGDGRQLGLGHVELRHHISGAGGEDQIGKVQHSRTEYQDEQNRPAVGTLHGIHTSLTLSFLFRFRAFPGREAARRLDRILVPHSLPECIIRFFDAVPVSFHPCSIQPLVNFKYNLPLWICKIVINRRTIRITFC